MKIMRVRRSHKNHLLIFLPETQRERVLMRELADAPSYSLSVDTGTAEDGVEVISERPGPALVVEYYDPPRLSVPAPATVEALPAEEEVEEVAS